MKRVTTRACYMYLRYHGTKYRTDRLEKFCTERRRKTHTDANLGWE